MHPLDIKPPNVSFLTCSNPALKCCSDTKNGAVPARPVPTLKTTPPAEQYNNAAFEGDGETGGRDGAK